MADGAGLEPGVAFLRALVAASREGEAAVQARVARALSGAGFEVARHRYRPAEVPLREEFADVSAMDGEEREAVVARLAGTGGGRSLILFAHPDGEPQRPDHGWRLDPFAGVLEGGRLHGWGVADDLSGVAIMVEAALRAASDGPMAGEVILASTPSKRHARGVHAVMNALFSAGWRADAALYLHPAESGRGMGEIKALAPGLLAFSVTLRGEAPDTREPGHAAFAHLGRNPVSSLPALLEALRGLDEARAARVRHPRLEAAVGRSTNLLVSRVEAFERAGRMPTTCRVTCALSFPPGESLSAVRAEVEAALAEPALRDAAPELAWLSGVTGAEVPDGHPFLAEAAAAVKAATGAPPHVNPLHTASDIRNPMVQHRVPCLGLGPLCGDLTQDGRRDEWVDAADHARAVEVVARLIRGWCGTVAAPAGAG